MKGEKPHQKLSTPNGSSLESSKLFQSKTLIFFYYTIKHGKSQLFQISRLKCNVSIGQLKALIEIFYNSRLFTQRISIFDM